MEGSKQPQEEEKKDFFDQLTIAKKVNESKQPQGWPNDPKDVPMRNDKEFWVFIRREWIDMILSIELEVSKSEESKDQDKKGLDQQSIHLEKLADMRKLITSYCSNDNKKPFTAWNLYFSSLTPVSIEELNVNLSKLIAATNSRAPLFQSLDRAKNFELDLAQNVTKLSEIVNERNQSKKYKKLDEIPSIEEYLKQIQITARALKTNIETFNQKEKENEDSRNEVIGLIKMQFGLQAHQKIIEELSSQEQLFFSKILKYRQQTYKFREKLNPYKFSINPRHQQALDECLSDEDNIIAVQSIKTKQKYAFYFGQMKLNQGQNLAIKEQNNEPSIFSRVFGRRDSTAQNSYTKLNYLLQSGAYMMHGRGMYFDKNTGELFEGWFEDDQFVEGRCILDDTYYVGSFITAQEGKFIKHGNGTCYYSNGTKYSGAWKNDLKHGNGETYFANKLRCEGQFKQGTPIGNVTFYMGQQKLTEQKYPEDDEKLQNVSNFLFEQKLREKNKPKPQLQ